MLLVPTTVKWFPQHTLVAIWYSAFYLLYLQYQMEHGAGAVSTRIGHQNMFLVSNKFGLSKLQAELVCAVLEKTHPAKTRVTLTFLKGTARKMVSQLDYVM